MDLFSVQKYHLQPGKSRETIPLKDLGMKMGIFIALLLLQPSTMPNYFLILLLLVPGPSSGKFGPWTHLG